jgi:formylmethanofuran dehydrogenase subunit E
MKYLFSEAWSEEGSNDYNNNNNNKKDGYCKVSSDVLKARLPKAIKITLQTEKLEYNKKNKNKTTRLEQQRQQQQKKKEEEEDYSPRVKSLKDFVQLFEQKEKEGKKPRIYVSY